jgi:hypothetical protein
VIRDVLTAPLIVLVWVVALVAMGVCYLLDCRRIAREGLPYRFPAEVV